MTRFLIAVALALLTAQGALSQTKARLDQRYKLLGYEAVGRLDSAHGHCTGALIARDVVMTAAHCVAGKGQSFTFRAGYSDGAAVATRTSKDVIIPRAYLDAKARGDVETEIANDVALVRLNSAIHEAGISPYQIARAPRRGTEVTLASYGRGRLEALTLERGCLYQKSYLGGIYSMNCDATFGSSGAPVFVQENGRTRIFSVVSSGSGSETLGMELGRLVPSLMSTLRERQSATPVSDGARRLRVGERASGGARFLRPPG